jgi:hypothetical protein
MDILGGFFVLTLIAGVAVWNIPAALLLIEARLHSRREALRVQRVVFQFHFAKLKGEQ